MKEAVRDILKEIFERSGYNTETSQEFDLVLRREGHRIGIIITNHPRSLDLPKEEKILLISTSDENYDFRRDVIFWSREELERQIGRAILSDIEGKPLEFSFEKKILNISSFPIRIDRSRALALSKLECASISLKFIPFWKFDYSLSAERRFGSETIELKGNGTISINALTGLPFSISYENLVDGVEIPEEKHFIERPVIPEERARMEVLEKIISDHSREVKFEEVRNQSIVTNIKIFKPEEKEIVLYSELVYLPVWEVQASDGYVKINAHTGEEILQPLDSGVEFL
ncbi:MAG: hypothetical protein ACXQT5_07065 [Candidatus Syntropharchaeia archaeon]